MYEYIRNAVFGGSKLNVTSHEAKLVDALLVLVGQVPRERRLLYWSDRTRELNEFRAVIQEGKETSATFGRFHEQLWDITLMLLLEEGGTFKKPKWVGLFHLEVKVGVIKEPLVGSPDTDAETHFEVLEEELGKKGISSKELSLPVVQHSLGSGRHWHVPALSSRMQGIYKMANAAGW